MAIHETAIVSPDTKIGKDVTIGPYSIIEDNVIIGDGTIIDSHVKIARYTTMGKKCRVYLGALIGEEPQDHRCVHGIKSYTEIGDETVIREYVTIHRSPFEEQKTIVGNHCLLMAFVHLGHDCILHNHITIANNTIIAGHVEIFDGAVLSASIAVHQFCRIGSMAMVAPMLKIVQDIPPFCLLNDDGHVHSPNVIALKRSGMSIEGRKSIKQAIKTYFFKGLIAKNAIAEIEENNNTPESKSFIDFIKNSERGIVAGNTK